MEPHSIAFCSADLSGGRMIIEGIRGGSDEDETPLRRRHSFLPLVTTVIATSLDAMAVGVGSAFCR